ncbi:hypothetical protein CRE_30935 [Caenorhabditis remanei]|uniref:Uncharacterized protein n=1 Tax=Caenorhabditis remanei TaxID=31234 RepID=E3LTN1_CAERE|nr:hypothetical protein CRE_30935 [Caenorhabditis remanei]
MIIPIVFALFAVCNSQKLLDLKSFNAGGDTKIDATGPYSIYVSASSDDDALLKQISVKTSDNQVKTLFDLKNNKLLVNTGLLQPFAVTTSAVVSSTLSQDQMNQLKGYLYVTTAQQLQNTKGFLVYDVGASEKIQISAGLMPDDVTIVFLNTNYKIQPYQPSTISAWVQAEGSSVNIYEGIPTDVDEKKDSQIFSNPVTLSGGNSKFFPTVQIFSLNLGSFYVKSHKGVQFVIESSFTDIDNSFTTAKTTTGFYMKPIASPDRKVTIHTGHDNNFNGTTGVNVVGNSANFAVTGPGNWAVTPSATIQPWSVATIADTLSFETVNSVAGEVFVQYYLIEGAQNIPTTTSLPGRSTTARGVQTTTKSTATVQFLTSMLIPVIGARLL